MTDNIIHIPTEPNKLAGAVEELKRNLEHLLEYQEISAKIKYKQYQSLVEAGFTAEQALFLCRGF